MSAPFTSKKAIPKHVTHQTVKETYLQWRHHICATHQI